jgi:hypothetical protein
VVGLDDPDVDADGGALVDVADLPVHPDVTATASAIATPAVTC